MTKADIIPGWKPIETAPKDGTRIIISGNIDWDNPVTTARWTGGYWIGGAYDNESCQPTLWLPITIPNLGKWLELHPELHSDLRKSLNLKDNDQS